MKEATSVSKSKWIERQLGPYNLRLLNLDHPDVEGEIISEIDSGVDVFYDRRWDITETFCSFLIKEPSWIQNRSVLVIGTGIGLETIIIGKLCKKIYINDLAPIALDLCTRQLEENNIRNFESISGRYEKINLPLVDVVVGSYLVYNRDTARSISSFLKSCPYPVLLMNENHPEFQETVQKYPGSKSLLKGDAFSLIFFSRRILPHDH